MTNGFGYSCVGMDDSGHCSPTHADLHGYGYLADQLPRLAANNGRAEYFTLAFFEVNLYKSFCMTIHILKLLAVGCIFNLSCFKISLIETDMRTIYQ